jgi:selenide,water dikinase
MKELNRDASQLAGELRLRGGTDITGYSLLGHGVEMAQASGVSLHFDFAEIPFISGAHKYARQGIFPGGAFDNKKHFESQIEFAGALEEPEQMLLFDPQTSGGLLLGVPRERVGSLLARAREMSQSVWVVGNVEAGKGIKIR